MKKRYILSVAGIALAAVFFMQTTTPPKETPEELANIEQLAKQAQDNTAAELRRWFGSTEDPMQKVTNDAAAKSEEQDQNSKELENPAENEMDKGADFEKSDNQGNENPQQQSLE